MYCCIASLQISHVFLKVYAGKYTNLIGGESCDVLGDMRLIVSKSEQYSMMVMEALL